MTYLNAIRNRFLSIPCNLKVVSCACRSYANTADTSYRYADVVIVGGGMVGTSLSCALAHSLKSANQRIVLLETTSEEPHKNWKSTPYENRVSSITPGSKSFLESIGVWEKVTSRRCNPYKDMYVWDGVSSGNIYLNSADVDHLNMAYMVENSVLIESCMERARELESIIEIKFNTKVKDIALPGMSSSLASVKLQNGEVIRTKLVVGADGPNSFVRNNVAKIKTMDYDYKQFAVVATLGVNCRDNLNTTAWQRFLPTGPIALLPMSSDTSSLVWSTTKEKAQELLQETEEGFVEKINEALLGNRGFDRSSILGLAEDAMSTLASVLQPGFLSSRYISRPPLVESVQHQSRGMFPLVLKHSPQYVKTRLALIGDAAHRIHPMAGLGVNLGFGDAECLSRSIASSLHIGEDIGCLEELLPYETERQRHVMAVVGAITGLHNLFSTSTAPLVLLRTLGLHLTNNISPVKDQIIKYAVQ